MPFHRMACTACKHRFIGYCLDDESESMSCPRCGGITIRGLEKYTLGELDRGYIPIDTFLKVATLPSDLMDHLMRDDDDLD